MIYKAVFLVVTHILFAAVFHHHFLAVKKRAGADPGVFTRKDYLIHLGRKAGGFFSTLFGPGRKGLVQRWLQSCSPIKEKWSFVGLYVSFTLLALTGFLFTLLGSVPMFGMPLVLHVSLGGFFAVCLAVVLLLRAERFFKSETRATKGNGIPVWLGKAMFWLFTLAGFFLICSALAMMLPVFSSQAQDDLFAVHRYSALTAFTSAIAHLYIAAVAKE